MTREQLAEFSGLTPGTVEDLEESDYQGDWKEAIKEINNGFQQSVEKVILPAAGMKPADYTVRCADVETEPPMAVQP